MMRFLLLLVGAVLVACSSTPTPTTSRKRVPAGRLYEPAFLLPVKGRSVRVSFTRDSGIVASAAGIDVFFNGEKIARLASGETIDVFLAPGQQILGAKFAWGGLAPIERPFTLHPGERMNVRVTTSSNGDLDLVPESGLL